MPYRFCPARPSRAIIGLVYLLYPVLLRARENVVRITVPPDDRQRLASLRGACALLLPNHPSETEPNVVVGLSRMLGERFYFVATHEIFRGFLGWLLPRMGVFSIRRGWPDHASLYQCRRILAEQGSKLVVFPEGETHMQHDLILPLHKGAVQIGFWALERMAALGRSPCLPLVPLVLRYRYVGNPLPPLRRGLARLERHIGVTGEESAPLPERLRRAGLVILEGVEREYGIQGVRGAPCSDGPDERIALLYDYIAERVTRALHAKMPTEQTVHLRMRALFNIVFDYLDGLAAAESSYERRLHRHRVAIGRACLADIWRVQNFMAIGEESFAPPVSAERMGETLWRLEREAFGKGRTCPPREALVRVGTPLELSDYLPHYRQARKATLACCTERVQKRLRELLDAAIDFRTPL